MGKHKAYCWACQDRYFPPTGKKCQNVENVKNDEMLTPSKVKKHGSGRSRDSQSNSQVISSVSALNKAAPVTHEKDSLAKRVLNPSHLNQSDTDEEDDSAEEAAGNVQSRILEELKKMNACLDIVEHQVAGTSGNSKQEKQDSKLSKSSKNKNSRRNVTSRTVYSESSESSSDDGEIPSLSELRASNKVQNQIDKKIAQLGKVHREGNDQGEKIKSQHGGPVDVVVRDKVPWPHEHILGGSHQAKGYI